MTEEELREKLYIVANNFREHTMAMAAILAAFAELRQERDAALERERVLREEMMPSCGRSVTPPWRGSGC